MLDQQSPFRSSQSSLSEADIGRRKIITDLTSDDVSRIRTLKDIFINESDRYTEASFARPGPMPSARRCASSS